MSLTPVEVLANIPGWNDATLTELSGGLSNQAWRVTAGGKSGVLKIDDGPREAPFNTRCDEANVQSAAFRAGLAPKIIFADTGLYFTEYVEGTVWERACLDKKANLETIAAGLRRLHALPLTGRSFDASVAVGRYTKNATGIDPNIIEKCTEIVARMRLPQNLCCCHNDLVAENLVATPELMFLDWEYACDNDPFFDLATIVEHHLLTDEQVVTLLDAYLDGNHQHWREHLESQRRLYLALLCMWMAARSDTDPEELQAVSERLLTSYS